MSTKPYSMKGELIRLISEGNPKGRLKAIDFNQFGGIERVEWHDDAEPAPTTAEAPSGPEPTQKDSP